MNRKVINESSLKDEIFQMNIFHHICYYRMQKFLFYFIDYAANFIYYKNKLQFKIFLENFMNQSSKDETTPFILASNSKFYEIFLICLDMEIKFFKIGTNKIKFDRFLVNLPTKPLDFPPYSNSFNYYCEFFNYLIQNFKKPFEFIKNYSQKKQLSGSLNQIAEFLTFGKLFVGDRQLTAANSAFLIDFTKDIHRVGNFNFLFMLYELFADEIFNEKTINSQQIGVKNEIFLFYILDKSNFINSFVAPAKPLDFCNKIFLKNVFSIFADDKIMAFLKKVSRKDEKILNEFRKEFPENVFREIFSHAIKNKFHVLINYLILTNPLIIIKHDTKGY